MMWIGVVTRIFLSITMFTLILECGAKALGALDSGMPLWFNAGGVIVYWFWFSNFAFGWSDAQ